MLDARYYRPCACAFCVAARAALAALEHDGGELAELRSELAELRSLLDGLSNRIESAFRVIDSRTGHLA